MAYPLVGGSLHLCMMILSCLFCWFFHPSAALVASISTCLGLVMFQHVSIWEAQTILCSHPVLLLVVGCLMAEVITKNKIHLVVSSFLLKTFRPSTELRLVLIMLGISGLISMWVSNTSVVAMLIPVVLHLSKSNDIGCEYLLLSIAYGATIGGMLTPIGTPANLVAIDYASRYFHIEIDFITWVLWALPFVVLLASMLALYFYRVMDDQPLSTTYTQQKVTYVQKRVMQLFGGCIFLWATQTFPNGGWSAWLGYHIKEEYIGMVAILLCALLQDQSHRAVVLSDIKRLPFTSIWMVITGIFMASGIENYGLVKQLIDFCLSDQWLYNYQTLILFGMLMSSVTELCNNTAITALGLPLSDIMMKLSHLEVLPCIFLITFSANSAFSLPTATPPNALILGTGRLQAKKLLWVGAQVSFYSLLILTILFSCI
nr:SLC13 family permease [Candidatus Synchoanobacter obligatus]